MSESTWNDLQPDAGMVAALDYADVGTPRPQALLGVRKDKHRWSNRFADACARMIAAELRQHPALKKLNVLPDDSGGSAEPPTFVAGDKSKKVDVVAASPVSGLQIGISLKGLNFRDNTHLNFDKNLTGRTYELQDEVRLIHGYQPASFMAAIYFVPIGSTADKRSSESQSSFAHIVEHLRHRTGRIDPTLPSQLEKVDSSAIALYNAGDEESIAYQRGGSEHQFSYQDPFPRGVVRYFDVQVDPPWRGRPRLSSTLSLKELLDLIVTRSRGATEPIDWAEPET